MRNVSSRRPNRRNATINITNLMDVMMVLLVVFMVLPKVGGKNLEGNETSINISVDKEGRYYIGKTEVKPEKIVAKVKAIRGENNTATVTISGDTDSAYGRVINLMALLKDTIHQE